MIAFISPAAFGLWYHRPEHVAWNHSPLRRSVSAEPVAARNECRAVLAGESGVCLAALMRELDR
jgi:hypothetical protein